MSHLRRFLTFYKSSQTEIKDRSLAKYNAKVSEMLHGDQNVFQSDVLPSVSSALVQNEVQYRLLAKITASDIECFAFNSYATTLLLCPSGLHIRWADVEGFYSGVTMFREILKL